MSETNNNLDISNIPSENVEELAQRIENFYKNDANTKSQLAWHWERNHLMLDGKQWLVFTGARDDAQGTIWQPLKVSKANEYIPRPTTNYIFDVYQTLKSYLIKNKPRSSVSPNTQTHRDKVAAKIGNLVLESLYEKLKESYNYEYAASCALSYGTVFKKDYWNTSSLMMAKIPKTMPTPVMDPMTGQVVGMEEKPVLDENGDEVFDYIPLGDVDTEIIEPYRLSLDPLATDLHKARWIMESSIQPIDLVKELYGKQGPGFTGLVDRIQEEKKLSGVMQRFYNLKQSSGTRNQGQWTQGQQGTTEMIEGACVVKEVYERPSMRYPKGRLIVVANGVTLYAHDSPCEGNEEGDWHPYSDFRWELVPGRFWGKSPLDDGVEIQKQINSIDSVIILTRKTMAIPQKLIPLGSGIGPGQWTGRPGQEVFYRPDPSGNQPGVIPAVGVSEQVFAERAQRLEDLKQITGAIDILKGDRPPGVTAASALNLLYEVGTGKLFPVLDRWKQFVESSQKKQLKLVSKKYKEPRPEFIKLLHSKNKELSPQEISHFIGTDLLDNCNVVVEAGSNIPKLQAAKQAAIQEVAQTGALQLENPVNRAEYLRQMGITGFDNDVGKDIKRAQWENDMLDDIGLSPDNKPIVLMYDDHDVHVKVHTDRMKEPSFMTLSQEAQQAYIMHIEEHNQFKVQSMQAAMMQAEGMGLPPEAGMQHAQAQSQGPQQQMSKQSAQPKESPGVKGPTKEQKNALRSDMLTPAPVGGSR